MQWQKLKIKKNSADKIPIEDTTPAITHSAKVLVRTTGAGASFGREAPEQLGIKSMGGHSMLSFYLAMSDFDLGIHKIHLSYLREYIPTLELPHHLWMYISPSFIAADWIVVSSI